MQGEEVHVHTPHSARNPPSSESTVPAGAETGTSASHNSVTAVPTAVPNGECTGEPIEGPIGARRSLPRGGATETEGIEVTIANHREKDCSCAEEDDLEACPSAASASAPVPEDSNWKSNTNNSEIGESSETCVPQFPSSPLPSASCIADAIGDPSGEDEDDLEACHPPRFDMTHSIEYVVPTPCARSSLREAQLNLGKVEEEEQKDVSIRSSHSFPRISTSEDETSMDTSATSAAVATTPRFDSTNSLQNVAPTEDREVSDADVKLADHFGSSAVAIQETDDTPRPGSVTHVRTTPSSSPSTSLIGADKSTTSRSPSQDAAVATAIGKEDLDEDELPAVITPSLCRHDSDSIPGAFCAGGPGMSRPPPSEQPTTIEEDCQTTVTAAATTLVSATLVCGTLSASDTSAASCELKDPPLAVAEPMQKRRRMVLCFLLWAVLTVIMVAVSVSLALIFTGKLVDGEKQIVPLEPTPTRAEVLTSLTPSVAPAALPPISPPVIPSSHRISMHSVTWGKVSTCLDDNYFTANALRITCGSFLEVLEMSDNAACTRQPWYPHHSGTLDRIPNPNSVTCRLSNSKPKTLPDGRLFEEVTATVLFSCRGTSHAARTATVDLQKTTARNCTQVSTVRNQVAPVDATVYINETNDTGTLSNSLLIGTDEAPDNTSTVKKNDENEAANNPANVTAGTTAEAARVPKSADNQGDDDVRHKRQLSRAGSSNAKFSPSAVARTRAIEEVLVRGGASSFMTLGRVCEANGDSDWELWQLYKCEKGEQMFVTSNGTEWPSTFASLNNLFLSDFSSFDDIIATGIDTSAVLAGLDLHDYNYLAGLNVQDIVDIVLSLESYCYYKSPCSPSSSCEDEEGCTTCEATVSPIQHSDSDLREECYYKSENAPSKEEIWEMVEDAYNPTNFVELLLLSL